MIDVGYWTRPLNFRQRRWSYHLLKATVAPAIAALFPPAGEQAHATIVLGVGLWVASKLVTVGSIPLTRDGAADLLLFTAAGWILLARELAGAWWSLAAAAVVVALYLAACRARWYDERELEVPAAYPVNPFLAWAEETLREDRT